MDERRTFSRVETRIRAFVRVVDSPDRLPMAYDNPLLTSEEKPDLSGANIHTALGDFLQAMDNKLDTILSSIHQERLRHEFPLEVEVVEAGGNGLRFVSGQPFEDNQPLEIVLVLNQYPLRLASAVGVVSRQEAIPSGTQWVMEFTRVREGDQEAIVSFVFREERERIRERKWTD